MTSAPPEHDMYREYNKLGDDPVTIEQFDGTRKDRLEDIYQRLVGEMTKAIQSGQPVIVFPKNQAGEIEYLNWREWGDMKVRLQRAFSTSNRCMEIGPFDFESKKISFYSRHRCFNFFNYC